MIIIAERLKPDVLILDLQPSVIDELELAAIIHRKTPATSIILICNKKIDVNKAINVSIRGFLHKEANAEEITSAIYAVLRGSFYISNPCISYINKKISPVKQSINPFQSLSLIERNIISYLAKGFDDYEIAKHLNHTKVQ